MTSKTVILFSAGGAIGFMAGNIFLAAKIMESKKMRRALSNIIADKISSKIFDESPKSKRVYYQYDAQRAHRIDHFIFDTKNEAEELLEDMTNIIGTYGSVSITDYYELCGVYDAPFIKGKYGWFNLNNASIKRIRDSYTIELPKAVAIS